jgi:N-acetylneuraminic acid mutarotase
MKRQARGLVLAPILGLCVATLARADHTVGNPGDPVRLLIAEARDDARIITIQVKPETLDATVTAAATFYRDNYAAIDSTLRDVRLEFVDEDWAHCASAVPAELTIYFSYPKCQQTVVNKGDAIKLLFHEVTHLLGKDDESLADEVSVSVYRTWLNLAVNRTPRWDAVNPNGAPMERSAQASVSYKDADGHQKLFVWGGCNENDDVGLECSTFLGDGGIYDVQEQTWTRVEPATAEAGSSSLWARRAHATAVFTGLNGPSARKILIFGGCSGEQYVCRTAYSSVLVYDLATRSWRTVESDSAPEARAKHHAFWTGEKMLVWGGVADPAGPGLGRSLSDGSLFDPSTENWTALASTDAPSPRRFASAVLTGDATAPNNRQLIVFGGCDRQVGRYCPHYYNDGGIYDFSTRRWRPLEAGSFGARAWHAAVWTGQSMVVWGGLNRAALRDGAVFTPGATAAEDRWLQISGVVDEGRWGHSGAWTGDRVIFWGGQAALGEPAQKVLEFYLPTAQVPFGRWETPLALASPVGRWLNSSHWLGDSLLVWGGISEFRSYLNSGGLYVPRMEP